MNLIHKFLKSMTVYDRLTPFIAQKLLTTCYKTCNTRRLLLQLESFKNLDSRFNDSINVLGEMFMIKVDDIGES